LRLRSNDRLPIRDVEAEEQQPPSGIQGPKAEMQRKLPVAAVTDVAFSFP